MPHIPRERVSVSGLYGLVIVVLIITVIAVVEHWGFAQYSITLGLFLLGISVILRLTDHDRSD